MKSTTLLCVSLVLFCFTVNTALSLPLRARSVFNRRSLAHASEDSSPSSSPNLTSLSTAVIDFSCLILQQAWRPGNTYNDPAALKPDSPEDCCLACFQDDRCKTWTYDTVTGACALKDAVAAPFGNTRYMSSGTKGTPGTNRVEFRVLPDGSRTAASGLAEDEILPAYKGCYSEKGTTYPGGDVLLETTAESDEACCELCHEDNECFSWHINVQTKKCVLNRNAPEKVTRGKNYAGAIVI